MSITISRVTCNKWGQELAATHETLHSVCDFLNNAVLQTRQGFNDGKSYNGGYIHPAPVKQGTFYLYPIEAGSFTLTPHPLEQHPLAVMEEVLTKEMLTSYLYEVCAVVVEAAAKVYIDHVMRGVTTPYHRMLSRKDAMVLMTNYHIAALREDMQRAMSFKDKAESLMYHAQHEKSKLFGQWGYSEGLLKRARHEINKRGAKVNKLRKESKELEDAVQHLAGENVRLTDDCSRLQRSIMDHSVSGYVGAPAHPYGGAHGVDVREVMRDIRDATNFIRAEEQHERERARVMPAFVLNLQICAQEFAESRKSFEKVMKIHALKERYKGLRGCGANDKRYQFRKSFQAASKFSQHVVRESLVLQSLRIKSDGVGQVEKAVTISGVSTPPYIRVAAEVLLRSLVRDKVAVACKIHIVYSYDKRCRMNLIAYSYAGEMHEVQHEFVDSPCNNWITVPPSIDAEFRRLYCRVYSVVGAFIG